MTITNFGNITLAEYKRLTTRRKSWTKRLGLAAAAVAACASLTAAGDFLGIWTGKGSRYLSVDAARDILQSSSIEKWQSDAAIGAIYAEIETLISDLGAAARAHEPSARYAGVYLQNAALAAIRQLKGLSEDGVLSGVDAHFGNIQKAARR